MSDDDLARHLRLHGPVSDCPLTGGRVTLLPSGADAIRAILDAIEAASDHVHLEYYTLDDVTLDGRSLFDLLEAKARSGIEVAVIWDAVGSGDTPDAQFDRLQAAGVRVLEYHSVNPLRRYFNISVNDRDHRKLAVVDGAVGILGGVNLSRVYETPECRGRGADPQHAFWIDCAVRITGPAVAEIQHLFLQTWRGLGADPAPLRVLGADAAPPRGGRARDIPGPHCEQGETLRIDGSAPRERRRLFNASIGAAIAGAHRRILLATGYFTPTVTEQGLLAEACRRGVAVDLLLAGYSDVPAAVHAARATYGRLLRAGARIHEVHRGMLHAKVATIDGVWSAVGSSNLDRRSVYFNNEIDAIVLGRHTASAVEAMLRAHIGRSVHVGLRDWQCRSLRERVAERVTRLWQPLI